MNQNSTNYLETWREIAHTTSLSLILASCLLYLIYLAVVSSMSNRSKKYSFVLRYETTIMFIAAIGLAMAVALVFNAFMLNERDFTHIFIFSIKAGLPIGLGVTIGYGVRAYLNVYYPFILEKRLADIRFRERKSPNGTPMVLLNEEDEDKYLTDEMQQQEEDQAFDFDVWLDNHTGETIIETYLGTTNRICPQCNFRTLKMVKEEISETTLLNTKYYQCSHCGHKEKVEEV